MRNRIFLSSPTIHGEERQFVQEAFDTNWVAPLGKNVDEFEREMAAFVGVSHAAALVSGTSALHLAVKLAGVKPGDTVLCSDMTFSATVNPVSYEGGRQVFVDSERETWNMDPQALELAFRKYPGLQGGGPGAPVWDPAKLDEITAVCDAHGAVLIEDAAESCPPPTRADRREPSANTAPSPSTGTVITTSGGGMLLSGGMSRLSKRRASGPLRHLGTLPLV